MPFLLNHSNRVCSTVIAFLLCFLLCSFYTVNTFAAGPVNDGCTAATAIPIPLAGYGLGTFTSLPTDLTSATVQTGETFAPAIFVAGLDKKSVWYKFSIPTIRAVRVTLTQPGTTITAGDAGFAVYQTSSCLPTNADISTKLTPIVTFGNTYHPCVPSGDYLIQVSANLNAKGPITIQVEISDQTGAAYDHPNQAYAFGTVGYYAHRIDFNTECQSIEDATEICTAFSNPTAYNKTAWLTFKTPSYFDYIVVQLSGTGVTSYFPSNNNAATYRTFGYTLYKGNAVTTPIASLTTIDGCDSIQSNGYYAGYKVYKCSDLDTGTVYSLQVFIKKDFADDIRIGIVTGGQVPTKGPKPLLAAVPAPNAIGNLAASPSGTLTTVTDVWGCNSRHTAPACGPSVPDSGISYSGRRYNLSSFFTFTLTSTSAVYFSSYITQCGPNPLVRVFSQGLTNTCAGLDTANIVGVFNYSGTIDCLPPGKYTVQVSGQDGTVGYDRFNYSVPIYNAEQCLGTNLGTGFRLDMTAYTRKAANKYALGITGAFDSVNRVGNAMQPLTDRVDYSSISDTIGCQPTLRPADTTCSPNNDKVIYRELVLSDSGTLYMSNLTFSNYSPMRYRLYQGDANALAKAQNVFAFPDKISGLKPITECMDFNTNCSNKSACVVPGTYTFTTMAGNADVGRADKPVFTFVRTRTKHNTPFAAQNLGSLWDSLGAGGGSITTDVDDWSCNDNAVTINGTVPNTVGGKVATKAIYRQFYLNQTSLVRIENIFYYYCYARAYGRKKLFYGKATDGFTGLSAVGGQWSDFDNAGATAGCDLLPAGWYTVVSYNQGPSYDSTFRSLNLDGRYNSSVGYNDEFKISITPSCPGPVFNRPYKASVATGSQPHSILLVNRVNSTPAYPRTDTTYILPKENFNCTIDTPFTKIPVKSCEAASNRVAFYVFKTTQQCFLQINTGGYYAAVYDKDVRIDSAQFLSRQPIQTCNNTAGYIQFCFFQPGTYTLVVFAKDADVCKSVTPSIYIDVTNRYSRFDYAKNAYDFGAVPPDSVWHYGKVGDVNPLNSGRAPSNDIFYCTTGASTTDPIEPVCYTDVNPNVYNSGPNRPLYDSLFPNNIYKQTRRNIWYTFVVAQPGYVTVRVESKTPAREYQQKFSVYRSNVDGTLPFSLVVSSGEVDSTVSQGLTHLGTNVQNYYYCANLNNTVQFYRDPCTSISTRYYVLAENVNAEPFEPGGTLPNTQTEVSVMIDSVTLVLPKHDHYSLAGDIGTVGVGKYTGDVDNYSCATKDPTDPIYYYNNSSQCQKTLWYKFTSTITGNVRFRIYINGTRKQDYYDVQLFKQLIANDSTTNGLQIQGYTGVYGTDNTYWAECCVAPGTYYLLLPGCAQVNASVYPEIELIEAVGDFCSRAVPSSISGPGSVTTSLLVNCHTIGTDYGEFGPQLTCPQGAKTSDYKSSWFRMDIGGTDTLDVTTYLVEKTNALSGDIKYRLMTGNCGAMQEQSCVLDALTQNTYQCLVPGQSYYVQVFTPVTKFNQAVNGTIDLHLSAIKHADTCAPLTNCLANANFTSLFDCKKDDSVKFVNFSTYGTSINYKWNFGYNGQTSTAVSPDFFYPVLPNDTTYTVKLVVDNISCGKKDSVTKTVSIPGRPYIKFGNDISSCNGLPVTLKATSFTGATYAWQNGSVADTFKVTATGNTDYWVKINYNGCSSADTVKVLVSPIAAKPKQNIIVCVDSVFVNASRGHGETYKWNTGATSYFIYVRIPGIYWVDLKYGNCIYRDSFVVNNAATSRPLGNDTTVCLSGGGYVLKAKTAGAVSYTWQNGSTADTFKVTTPGQYHVNINFGSCVVKDTVNITGFPAAVIINTDTVICTGSSLILPWGKILTKAGIYRDTIHFDAGCDSLVRRVTVTTYPRPFIGNDTTVCLASPYLLNAVTAGAVSYFWQDGTTNSTLGANGPGLYWVSVNFGTCSSRDSIVILGSPPPVTTVTDTLACFGSSLTLSWGKTVSVTGSYSDTIRTISGCDSVIRIVNLTVQPKPSLGNDTTLNICGNKNINLTTVYNTSGLNANWTFGGTSVTNPASVNIAGIYRLIASNTNGCRDTALLTLLVSPKPILGTDAVANICQGNVFDLTSVYNTAGLTTNWTLSNIAVGNPTSVNSSGVYQLIAINTAGCADTAEVTLTVSTQLNLGKDTIINICSGSNLNLTGIYNTTGLSTAWSLNNIPVGNPTAITAGGAYRLIASGTSGCADTALVTVSFNAKPSLGNDIAVRICQGNVYNLNNAFNTNGLVSNWTMNNLSVSNLSAINASGVYQLIATNSSGCADTATVALTVDARPSLGNDTAISICRGNTVNLANGYNTTNLTSAWTVNNIAVSNPSAITTGGVYRLIASNPSGCADTALVTISFNPKPLMGNDTTVNSCQGNSLNLTGLYNTAALASSWTFNNAPVANTAVVTAPGAYRLIVNNSFNCADTAIVTLVFNPKPSLGNDTAITICQGNMVNLNGIYATAGLTANWTVSNATVNPVAVATAGVYQLIVTNASGCRDTAAVTLTVNAKPAIGNDTSIAICQGQAASLIGLYNTTGLTRYWSSNSVAINNLSAVSSAGIYRLIVSSNQGCSDTAMVTLALSTKPNLGNDTSINICQGSSINLTMVYNTGNNLSVWSKGGVTISNPAAIVAPGLYQFISTTTAGCSDTVQLSLSVILKPIVVTNNPAVICPAQQINLTAASITSGSANGLVFTYWQNVTATIPYSTPTAAPGGLYYIKGTNATGCFDIKPVTVRNYPVPVVNAGADVTICNNDSTRLSASVTNTTAPVTYQWEPVNAGGIRNPTSASTVVKPAATVQYIVTVKDGYGCNYLVKDGILVTMQPPVPAFAGNDTIAAIGVPHQLVAAGGINYTWAPASVLNNPFIANPLATIYADVTLFTVTVKDNAGCTGYDTVKIKAYKGNAYYVPNAFSPNGDGLNDFFRPVPVGIASTELFRIFNRYGQLVFETSQLSKGWDGTQKGIAQPVGNFVWILKGKGLDGKVIEMKGNVLLVR